MKTKRLDLVATLTIALLMMTSMTGSASAMMAAQPDCTEDEAALTTGMTSITSASSDLSAFAGGPTFSETGTTTVGAVWTCTGVSAPNPPVVGQKATCTVTCTSPGEPNKTSTTSTPNVKIAACWSGGCTLQATAAQNILN